MVRFEMAPAYLMQADFTRAEGEFAKWVFDPEDAKSRTTAGDTFGRIGGEFKSHAIVLEAAKQKIENEIEKTCKQMRSLLVPWLQETNEMANA